MDKKDFKVEFDPVSSGWGCIHVCAGRHEINIVTSYAFDPHEELIEWLSDIIDLKEECLIGIDEEGHIIEMIVKQRPEDIFLTFIIKDYNFPDTLGSQEYLKMVIEKSVFMGEFLSGYRLYLESKFNPKDWALIGDPRMPFNWLDLVKDLEKKYNALQH